MSRHRLAVAVRVLALTGVLSGCLTAPLLVVPPVVFQGVTFKAFPTDRFGNSIHGELEVTRGPDSSIDRIDLPCVQLVVDGVRSEYADHDGFSPDAGGPLKLNPEGRVKVPVAWTFRTDLPPGGTGRSESIQLQVNCIRSGPAKSTPIR